MFDAASTGGRHRAHRIVRGTIDRLMSRLVRDDRMILRYPDGSESQFGTGPVVTVEITSWRAARRILLDPGLAFGEAYMEGTLVPHGCGIADVLDVLLRADRSGGLGPIAAARFTVDRVRKRIDQLNPVRRARRNAAHHYDLDFELYRLLLDDDLQYSCAYFRRGDETLGEAQAAKKRLLAAKLVLDRPGLNVLDIGCGWGGLALTLARDHGARVTGITLSAEQLRVARARAEAAGLSHLVRFELMDYRQVPLTFDRIVSVGMFEHVGITHYRRFFDTIRRCLEPDGIAVVHAIGRSHGPRTTNAWLRRYIFPGGYSPALSEVLPGVEQSGLVMTDLEVLRLHYARTLAHWRANLERGREQVLARHDPAFFRMVEFYLAGAELAFRRTGHMVWQMQLARRQDAAPLTRDYLSG